MSVIPASAIVQVTPGVINAGGSALDLVGLMLTTSTRIPIGTVPSFPSVAAVSAYFGPSAAEVAAATVYFAGFVNSNVLPGALLFTQYPWDAPVSAYIRGGDVEAIGLTAVKALTGVLTITIDGTAATSSTITLTSVASFSAAAALITTAIGVSGVVCSFDSVSGAFVITSGTTGATSAISYASGSIAAGLMLTQATGAVLSQGSAIATPAAFMAGLTQVTMNWASFMTLFEPITTDKVLFAEWACSTNNAGAQIDRFVYAMWDTITAEEAASPNDTSSAGYLCKQAGTSGTLPIAGDPALSLPAVDIMNCAVFALAWAASLDFTETNGRATLAFKSSSGGLVPIVTSQTVAANMLTNGYNFYGIYATANQSFIFFYNGQVTGPFGWADSYVNQIWMNNSFQLGRLELLTQVKSIPYNAPGYAMVLSADLDTITAALNFGAIRPGVTLSAAQIAEVNNAAGFNIATTLQTTGWYDLIQDALPQVRAARGSPPSTFFYTDGQSVQQLNLASIEVE